MTELFDPPMDKEKLPRFHITTPYCLMVAALGLAPAVVADEIANPSINWRSVVSLEQKPAHDERGFCDSFNQHPQNEFGKLVERVVWGHEPKPPVFEAK